MKTLNKFLAVVVVAILFVATIPMTAFASADKMDHENVSDMLVDEKAIGQICQIVL